VTTLSERKLCFHSKHNAITLFQKTHTTHNALSFAVLPLALLATRVASPTTVVRSTAAHRYCLHIASRANLHVRRVMKIPSFTLDIHKSRFSTSSFSRYTLKMKTLSSIFTRVFMSL